MSAKEQDSNNQIVVPPEKIGQALRYSNRILHMLYALMAVVPTGALYTAHELLVGGDLKHAAATGGATAVALASGVSYVVLNDRRMRALLNADKNADSIIKKQTSRYSDSKPLL